MSDTLKVAHVISDLAVGGAEKMLLKLVSAGDPQIRHSVISLRSTSTVGTQLMAVGASVTALGMRGGRLPGIGTLRLARELRNLSPDVIQGWMYHGDLASMFGHLTSARHAGLVWSIRCSLNMDAQSKLTQLVIRGGAQLSTYPVSIIYNSARARRQHEAIGYRADRGLVIPNGFDLQEFSQKPAKRAEARNLLGIASNQLAVGLVARLHPVKGHSTFLKAALTVARSNPNAVFVAAGRGVPKIGASLHELRSIVAELGPRLILRDEQHDIPALMNALDLCVLCSVTEGFPNVLGEAMACGTPCVATDVGDCQEIIGDTGITTVSNSPEHLASSIVAMLSKTEGERLDLGARARRRIEDNYSLANVVRQYEGVWRGASDRQRATHRVTLPLGLKS